MRPIKYRTRIGFAPRCDVGMPRDACRRNAGIRLHEGARHRNELGILRARIGRIVAAFQFNADGKIIAGFASFEIRHTRVPGAALEWHELHQLAITAY